MKNKNFFMLPNEIFEIKTPPSAFFVCLIQLHLVISINFHQIEKQICLRLYFLNIHNYIRESYRYLLK